MWRVVLSIAAVVFDVLFLILLLLAFIGLAAPTSEVTITAAGPEPAESPGERLVTLIVVALLAVGVALNIAAVAVGARLRPKQGRSDLAAEFS